MSHEASEKVYDALCRLIAAWVNGVSPEIEETPDFEALFLAADRHALSAAACFALESTGFMARCPAETAQRFQLEKARSIRRMILMRAEMEKVLSLLEENGIWYMPLKGAVINGLYPQYGARQFADVDVLFDADRWRDVRDIMQNQGFEVKNLLRGIHDTYHKPPVYNFNMHRRLFASWETPVKTACTNYYENVKQRLIKDGDNGFGYHFSDEDFYNYFLAHSYGHYAGGGAGLRTVLDVYIYRRAKPDMDEDYIAAELEKLGLRDFEALLRSLGEKTFGPRPGELTGPERQALELIESYGVYGTLDSNVQSRLRQLQGQVGAGPARRSTRAKYLLGRIFPGRDWYRQQEPFVYDHPWATPFYWVFRLFRGLFKNGKRNLRELCAVCRAPKEK